MKKLRIAQVAPTWYSIPPQKYGGAEQIISALSDGLVERGHNVTLFANADSKTSAKLISLQKKSPEISLDSLLNFENNMNYLFNHFLAAEDKNQFDIIHWHVSKDLLPLMISNLISTPSIITFHNYYPQANIKNIYQFYSQRRRNHIYYIAVSHGYQKFLPFKFDAVIYNGIHVKDFHPIIKKENYLFWIGRFLPVKGPDLAIKIAQDLDLPLKLAARKVGNIQLKYFNQKIKPFLNNKIEYVGEVGLRQKDKLYSKAKVLINPVLFDEPFGLIVPEANAAGTPVISFARGAMPELIKNGYNGFLIDPGNLKEMEKIVQKIYSLTDIEYHRLCLNCRQYVEKKFPIEKMIDGYEKQYQKIFIHHRS